MPNFKLLIIIVFVFIQRSGQYMNKVDNNVYGINANGRGPVDENIIESDESYLVRNQLGQIRSELANLNPIVVYEFPVKKLYKKKHTTKFKSKKFRGKKRQVKKKNKYKKKEFKNNKKNKNNKNNKKNKSNDICDLRIQLENLLNQLQSNDLSSSNE